ncbi:hypothetical protein OC846_005610 [Tilletia horrida]|uniref:DNA replication factor Cdt1 C-terminal domain-containing protein n=1 Tax=Tilletia horrida TaxID=155126 RepID=A0AAN6JQ22_9BASI|nr:hypothetical protein OC845_005761 [Tilletia horrida]KAK0545558.1 hypothetical protein OC846_005610 [Tilletia horrida]KAK0561548.1 hypothetical protein OC861_005758 [Tilletia horrida]
MIRPSTPPPTPAPKRQRTAVDSTSAAAAAFDDPVDPKELLGSPASSSRSRSSTKRPRSAHSTSSSASTASPRRRGSSSNPPSSPDLSILDPSTKRAVALASPSSRSPHQSPSSVLSFPSSPTATPASRVRHNKNSSTLDSIGSSRSGSSSGRSTLAPSSASSSRTLVNVSGGSSKSSSSTSTTSSISNTVGRALSLRERIEAKEQTRLKELEGLTKRHNSLFARAAAGRDDASAAGKSTSEPSLGLGITDPDAAVLAGPPPSKSSLSSSTRRTNKTQTSSKVLPSRTGSTLGATRHQTAVLMDVLKRKSLLSRLPEIADSLYMLFTHAAAAQGATLSSRGPHLGQTEPSPSLSSSSSSSTSSESLSQRASDQQDQEKNGISAITATPRVPVLPLSEVLTSLTRSSRTILSRVELREALSMLVEFVPGFLEIRTVGQGGAEWATLGFGRGSQPLGLKEVREKLKTLV